VLDAHFVVGPDIAPFEQFSLMTPDPVINIGTVIGAGVGFAGVILTLLYNARQARKQQERQWQYERERAEAKDADERTAIRSALTAELRAMLRPIQIFLESAEEDKEKGMLFPVQMETELSTEIYRTILPRIIMLSTLEISALTGAYTDFIRQMKLSSSRDLTRTHPELYSQDADLYIGTMKRVAMNIKVALKILAQQQDECG